MATLLIFGASRGLGAAISAGLPLPGDTVWCVSRSEPAELKRTDGVQRRWIQADLAEASAIDTIADQLGSAPVDVFIYNAGIWESASFEEVSEAELQRIVQVNLTSLLLAARRLAPNLKAAVAAKVILIGSTCGLENEGGTAVAYAATKFGMRGAAHALREVFRPHGIAVTCLSPGSIASDLTWEEGPEAALERHRRERIPVHDIVKLLRCLIELSPAACIKEIDMPALRDTDV